MGQQSLMIFCVERSVTEKIRVEAAMAYIKAFEQAIQNVSEPPTNKLTRVIAKHMT
jgi:hypothetical protein